MVRGLCAGGACGDDASRDARHPRGRRPVPVPPTGDFPMQWQTPTATDFRFGFEITMYVAAR